MRRVLQWLVDDLRRFMDAQLVGSDVYDGIRTPRRKAP